VTEPQAPAPRFVKAATIRELSPGTFLRVTIEGHALVLARDDDIVHAFQGTCPHEMADLSQGRIEDNCLICPRHLATFDLRDGAVSNGWKHVAPLKLYPVRRDGEDVLVDAAAVAINPPRGKRRVWDFSR
jgi:3-phenylpropionate/trans-cinnamate dioxygenase ferredoxin component